MSRERHDLLTRLFAEACRLEPAELPAFLDRSCGADAALRAELERFLAADCAALPLTGSPSRRMALGEALRAGRRVLPEQIGGYRISGVLGEGGMGIVYAAEQAQPRRAVALKVLKHLDLSDRRRVRFEREAQALARLVHPGIARLYDYGISDDDDDIPYLAMELVVGDTLVVHANARKLSTRDRIELFCRVCDAVDAAHRAGVVHRDLKPQNILVSCEEGATPQPKLLDFGVARVLDSEAEALTLQTEHAQLLGTLPYMSPEQVAAGDGEVDARSDVYALGVVLFELLAGDLPLDVGRLSLPEASRCIQEQEPPPLGTVDARFRGDLETIAAKALEKEPAARYVTAAALAVDLREHLADRPITARRASALVRLRKFTRRHRAVVAGAASAFVGLLIAVTALWIRATDLERAAVFNAETLEALDGVIAKNDINPLVPADDAPRGPAARLGDVMAASLHADDIDTPEVEAAVRSRRGLGLVNAGHWRDGERDLERAVQLHAEHPGAAEGGRSSAELGLAWVRLLLGDVASARRLAVAARSELEKLGRQGSEDWCAALTYEGWALLMLQDAPDEPCERLLEQASPGASAARAWALLAMAKHRVFEGSPVEAESLLARARAEVARIEGHHLVRAVTSYVAANAALRHGDAAQALRLVDDAAAELVPLVGPGANDWHDHWFEVRAQALIVEGDAATAQRELCAVLPRIQERLGADNARVESMAWLLASLYAKQGEFEDVCALWASWRDRARGQARDSGIRHLLAAQWAFLLRRAGADEAHDVLLADLRAEIDPWLSSPPLEPGWHRQAMVNVARLLQGSEPAAAARYVHAALRAWRARGDTERRAFVRATALAAKIDRALGR